MKRDVEARLRLSDGRVVYQVRGPSGRVTYRATGGRRKSDLLHAAAGRLRGRLARTRDSARRSWLSSALRAARAGAGS